MAVIEKADDGRLGAFVPDLPGCVRCADNIQEVRGLIAEAVAAHLGISGPPVNLE